MVTMACSCWLSLALALLRWASVAEGGRILSESEWQGGKIVMPTEGSLHKKNEEVETEKGKRWAILIAGSAGYGNYRHQADVCHAYQLLLQGGLKEENIVVFMYDDIANNLENPLPGKIINSPEAVDVYRGVPKDYTKNEVTVNNFFAVLLGNKSALRGGSGKVVDSSPDDHIFIYYTDHGGPGVLGMPNPPFLYADDFVETLKQKHAAGSYKKMVIYVEACESGSIFEEMLPDGMNIYVTTASNAEESSWATYCPGMYSYLLPGFDVCLGDLYSVAWMEDSEAHDLQRETLRDQYTRVKSRTSNQKTYNLGSHVMQYGDTEIDKEQLSLYLGFNPANQNLTFVAPHSPAKFNTNSLIRLQSFTEVHQHDADLLHLWHKYLNADLQSSRKADALKEMMKMISHRTHIDTSISLMGDILFGPDVSSVVLKAVRPVGKPLVDDWNCLKSTVRAFEAQCGLLSQYGMKHMRAFAGICNVGKDAAAVAEAAAQACLFQSFKHPDAIWAPATNTFSA